MRQQEAKKWSKEIIALSEGKTIQWYNALSNKWYDVDCP